MIEKQVENLIRNEARTEQPMRIVGTNRIIAKLRRLFPECRLTDRERADSVLDVCSQRGLAAVYDPYR